MPKKKATKASSVVPTALRRLYQRAETEPPLAALKTLTAKSLSLRGRSVMLQRDFAVALHALGRNREALTVADWPQRAVQYRGKVDAWHSASAAWAVTARIRRSAGDAQEPLRDLGRFVERPAHAMLLQPELWDLTRFKAVAHHETARFDDAARREGVLATDSMAWAIGELIYFRETAVPPFPHASFDLRWLDERITTLLSRLASRLTDAA